MDIFGTVSKLPLLHISSTFAYRWHISLAKPVSVLQNVEIWPCQEQQSNSAKFQCCCSGHLEQSSETFGLILHLWTTVPAWIGNPRLPVGLFIFSALTLLGGQQEGYPAHKNWVVRYWCGCLSAARCKWFAYGPVDATATPSSLTPVKSRMLYLSGAGLPTLSWKRAIKQM